MEELFSDIDVKCFDVCAKILRNIRDNMRVTSLSQYCDPSDPEKKYCVAIYIATAVAEDNTFIRLSQYCDDSSPMVR